MKPQQARSGFTCALPRVRMAPSARMPVLRYSTAGDNHLPGRPARFRAASSLRRVCTFRGSSVKYTESHSQRSARSFSFLMVRERSRVARASSLQMSRVSARPNRRARSPKSRSGSCMSSAVLAMVLPRPIFLASRSATRTPAVANRYAQSAPVMPPPTMTTSTSSFPRCVGYAALWLVVSEPKRLAVP